MLSCDYCSDWFHWECVGLRPPSDDEEDEDVAPPDFRCPACCRKVYLCCECLPLWGCAALLVLSQAQSTPWGRSCALHVGI